MAIKEVKIILVDDNIIFRSALKKFIEKQYKFKVIAEMGNGKELISQINIILDADIIIMDIMMPEMDGYTTARRITWHFHQAKVLAITMHYEKAYLQKLIEQGFKGCIFKNQVFETLFDGIQCILSGKLFFPNEILINPKF
jgi:two-component system, NarL family, response regulator NreC